MERDLWSQWRTDCPSCEHDGLIVESVVLSSTGKKHYPNSTLFADGFEVFALGSSGESDDEPDDQSTEDEVVKCPGCGKRFGLPELELK